MVKDAQCQIYISKYAWIIYVCSVFMCRSDPQGLVYYRRGMCVCVSVCMFVCPGDNGLFMFLSEYEKYYG